VALEAAVFAAWFRNDAVTAQKWFSQVRKLKTIPQLLRIRANVALACARAEYEQALVAWQQGLTFIDALPATAARKQLKDGWLEWQDEMRERQDRAAVVATTVAPIDQYSPM
jgi:hypothetical protein